MSDCVIRKRRHRTCNALGRQFACGTGGYWYAACPRCGLEIIGRYMPYDRSTRKITKDRLHQHLRKEHAEPGGYSSELRA